MTIKLKYKGQCRTCGASLPAGIEANWQGKGKVYCLDCEASNSPQGVSNYSIGSTGKEYYQNKHGRCEDAPCCGCCNC